MFSLKGDFTYKIEPVPEPKDTSMDGPNGHMLAMLQEMNQNRKVWTIQDFVDHDNLGGGKHRSGRSVQPRQAGGAEADPAL